MTITLSEMVSAYNERVSNLTLGLTSVSASISDLQDQKDEAENTLSVITSASDEWGEAKADSYGLIYSWCTSGDYGISNLTEWAVVSGSCSGSHVVVYTWSDVTSATEYDQWRRKLDFDEIYDHIHDSVDLNGTYGLSANITNLQTAQDVLQADKNKYEKLVDVYGRYA